MPSVEISSTQGIVSTSGSGFSLSGLPLVPNVENFEGLSSLSISGILAHDTDGDAAAGTNVDLSDKYLRLCNAAGEDFYLWFDIGGIGTDPNTDNAISASITELAITNAAADLATIEDVANLIVDRINGTNDFVADNGASGLFAEAVDEGGGAFSVTVYSLAVGRLTGGSGTFGAGNLVALGDDENNFTVSASDAADAPRLVGDHAATENACRGYGSSLFTVDDSQLSAAAAESDGTVRPLTLDMDDGATAGARKTLVFEGLTLNTQEAVVSFTGRRVGGAAGARTIKATGGASGGGWIHLIWDGSAWVEVGKDSVILADA